MRSKKGGGPSRAVLRRSWASTSSAVRIVARCASVALRKSVADAARARASTSARPSRNCFRSSSGARPASSRSTNRWTSAARAPGVSVGGMIMSAIVATVSLWCGSSTRRPPARARACARRPTPNSWSVSSPEMAGSAIAVLRERSRSRRFMEALKNRPNVGSPLDAGRALTGHPAVVCLCILLHKSTGGRDMGPLVVLAYSGGLDTSAIVPWLREKYGARVLCFAADVGQGAGELAGLVEKAKRSGAVDCVVQDLREEFVHDFVFPTLRAGAVYARTYLLGTAMARPVMAAHHVALAQQVGAQALAHGCTGKGNDQVRFELTYAALAPELQVIAPWREWQFKSREDLIAYVKAKGVPVQATVDKPYSTDRNLWHCSHEGGILEDPSKEPPEHIFVMTKDPLEAPDLPVVVEIGFEEGTPVSVNHVPMGPVELLESLNATAGGHGVGRAGVLGGRGGRRKSRRVYETHGGSLLHAAHRELEQLVLDRRTLRLKDELALRYADLVYDGRWWTPEREALDAAVASTQKRVTGAVRLKLFKGGLTVAGRESPYALYQPSYATFGKDNVYDQKDAEGFIHLYGLSIRIGSGLEAARRQEEVGAAAD